MAKAAGDSMSGKFQFEYEKQLDAKDQRIEAMAELLEFLTHDIVAWKTNAIGVITGQRCATDCPACAWEKLKGQM
jgi:hypothetical protein